MIYLSPTEPIVVQLRPETELFFQPGNAFKLVSNTQTSCTLKATAPAGVTGYFSVTEDGAPVQEFMFVHGGETTLDFTELVGVPEAPTPEPEPAVREDAAAPAPAIDRNALGVDDPKVPTPR